MLWVLMAGCGTDHQGSSAAKVEDWFADAAIDRAAFLADELEVLLGGPGVELAAAGPLELHGDGNAEYVNPLGEVVPMLIMAPGGAPFGGSQAELAGGAPLLIALHQTTDIGGAEPCDADATDDMAYGTYFATQGYLVVCPTLSFTGSRQPEAQWDTAAFYAKYPTWSAMGKDVQEVSWLLDAFTAAGVDTARTTLVGHSQGAMYALYAAATDERVARVVANAGFVDTLLDPDPQRWSRPTWYRAFRNLPVGLDQLEVVAAIAPRCALLIDYAQDQVLVATSPSRARLTSFQDQFPTITWLQPDGVHSWPPAQLERAADWLAASGRECTAE